jgi:putative transposase
MARLPRIVVPNQPLHIMHRGNNRQDIFESDEDMTRIKEDISVSLDKTECSLHAYVIMTNHLHLLISPKDKAHLAKFMQSLANRYVRYFNVQRSRTGTIWEGRFKSCLVDSDQYLFRLYKYIEMNPVRAGIVESASDYGWSSYHHNALGEKDVLITEHVLYHGLDQDIGGRCRQYQALFDEQNGEREDAKITQTTMKGEVYGSEGFHERIGKLVKRVTKLGSHGGDRKSEEYKSS